MSKALDWRTIVTCCRVLAVAVMFIIFIDTATTETYKLSMLVAGKDSAKRCMMVAGRGPAKRCMRVAGRRPVLRSLLWAAHAAVEL